MSSEKLEHQLKFFDTLNYEIGFPCPHRNQKSYIDMDGVVTWAHVFNLYLRFKVPTEGLNDAVNEAAAVISSIASVMDCGKEYESDKLDLYCSKQVGNVAKNVDESRVKEGNTSDNNKDEDDGNKESENEIGNDEGNGEVNDRESDVKSDEEGDEEGEEEGNEEGNDENDEYSDEERDGEIESVHAYYTNKEIVKDVATKYKEQVLQETKSKLSSVGMEN